jgi:5'-deoxynucleotidase YfbR-like HD superfamily hydrolase
MKIKNTQENKYKDKTNDFIKFIFGPSRRLNQINRFNIRFRSYNEKVSSHSYYVALYSLILSDFLIDLGYEINIKKVVYSSILHDIEESISGDTIRPFKLQFKKEYDTLAKLSAKEVLDDLPTNLKDKYLDYWEKDEKCIEFLIVKIADDLSGLVYCHEQIKLGNKTFGPIYEDYKNHLDRKLKKMENNQLYEGIMDAIKTEILINDEI